MREIQQTPGKMVQDGRVVRWGLFATPFRDIDLEGLDLRVAGVKVPRCLRKFRLKEWQHVAIAGADVMMGLALVDAHYLGNSWCWVADRGTGTFVEHARETAATAVRTARTLWDDGCSFRAGGYEARIDNRLSQGRHHVEVRIAARGGRPAIEAVLDLDADLARMQPLELVEPVAPERPLYTHKSASPVSGFLRVGDRRYELDPARDAALLDVQKTYYPYRTFWKWATFAGRAADGRLVGLNLCQNLIADDEAFNENVLWDGGRMTPLAAARFEFDPADTMKPWRMRTTDGKVDLVFTPTGRRVGHINAGILLSDYQLGYGTFAGTLVLDDGSRFEVPGFPGVVENHVARF